MRDSITGANLCRWPGRGTQPLIWATFRAAVPAWSADSGTRLSPIAKRDNYNREFSLAPESHDKFRENGVFVAGCSQSKRDWRSDHGNQTRERVEGSVRILPWSLFTPRADRPGRTAAR